MDTLSDTAGNDCGPRVLVTERRCVLKAVLSFVAIEEIQAAKCMESCITECEN